MNSRKHPPSSQEKFFGLKLGFETSGGFAPSDDGVVKKLFLVMTAVLTGLALSVNAQIPAFPGAEGFGAWSTGGRGGDVYIVTNLNLSGPGSFAQGIKTVPPQGRTIVFAVSGYIPISKLALKSSNVTIAGQTAPGDGMGLRGSSFWMSGSNTVIRFMRFRHGKDGNGGDALDTDGGAANLIMDHCEAMFGRDENFSMYKAAPPTATFQWSINAWGLQHHSAGGLWRVAHTTAHHTLWANNHTRNPKSIRPLAFDWVNNVTFGWDIGFNLAGADVPGVYRANIRGSTFIHGGKTESAIFGGGVATNGTMPFRIYVDDSALDGNGNGKLDFSATNYGVIAGDRYHRELTPFPQTFSANPAQTQDAVLGVPVTVDDRATAYKKVISQVGALRMEIDPSQPLRDEVTALLIKEVTELRRNIITNETDLAVSGRGFGTLNSSPSPVDSDRDGMPDYWEKTLGSNPDKDDHNEVFLGKAGLIAGKTFFPPKTPVGYTRLEEYLHFLAIPHGVVAKNGEVQVDLRKFASGFTVFPVFKISDVSGGTTTQSGEGGCMVTFTPRRDYIGRAMFDFTVTDGEGSSWRQTCALLIREP